MAERQREVRMQELFDYAEHTVGALVDDELIAAAQVPSVEMAANMLAGALSSMWSAGFSFVYDGEDVDPTEVIDEMFRGFQEQKWADHARRTREALEERHDAGVRLGRPPTLPDELRTRIRVLHADEGLSLAAIARKLNAENVPTAQGGARWYSSSVRSVIRCA